MTLNLILSHTALDRDTLIRTVWGEARGEDQKGMAAVVWVILNRAAFKTAWWGHTDFEVCHHAMQFSCWNFNDPNYPKLLALTPDDADYKMIAAIVDGALAGRVPDPTRGATHYKVLGTVASWDKAVIGKPSVTIGHHIFFNLGPNA